MILEVKGGSFGYRKDYNILNDINFTLKSGEILSVLGPNGAGKTTLLKCIIGLNKWTSGFTYKDGNNINNINRNRLWDKIAYVPQNKQSATSFTAEEMIVLGRNSKIKVFGQPAKSDVQAVYNVMEKLNIEYLSGRKCNEMSGGELQMVLIAKALVSEPELIVLDEPESNLDFKNQLTVLDAISSLKNENVACIFNTHYPTHALQRSDYSLLLDLKRKNLFGKTSEILTESSIEYAFGVKAVIDEIETENTTLRNVTPISLADNKLNHKDKITLAVVSIVILNKNCSGAVNELIHSYNKHLFGRMGMPNKKYGVNIINLNLEGTKAELETFTAELSAINGVNVKTVYVSE